MIDTGDARPFRQTASSLSRPKKDEGEKIIQQMQQEGVI